MEAIRLGTRRELMVDDTFLLDCGGVHFVLHTPVRSHDAFYPNLPSDGTGMSYPVVFRDPVRNNFRMYFLAHGHPKEDGDRLIQRAVAEEKAAETAETSYRGPTPAHAMSGFGYTNLSCAESEDGVHWTRPGLNLYEYRPGEANAIVYQIPGDCLDNVSPNPDPNPTCPPEERYKALCERVIGGRAVLNAMISADGYRWQDIGTVVEDGTFDTLNTWFYSSEDGLYHAYIRSWHHHNPGRGLGESGKGEKTYENATETRAVFTCVSKDFRSWSKPVPLDYGAAPDYQMYTNNVQPYFRAPHILLGFPTRYYERMWIRNFDRMPDPDWRKEAAARMVREGTALTDGLFMSSRDGVNFKRWDFPAFLGAGVEHDGSWRYGDGYLAYGMLVTKSDLPGAPDELSFYSYDIGCRCVRRYTLRMDGFVSLRAGYPACDVLTKPFVFEGGRLLMNYAACVAGGLRAELLDERRNPIEGFTMADCDELIGDAVDREVTWNGSADVSALAGKTVHLRIRMREADLYAFAFA